MPTVVDPALARLRHEVRTALAAILGHAELLERADSIDDMHESAAHITSEGHRLLAILDSVATTDAGDFAGDGDGDGAEVRHILHVEDDPANLRLVRRLTASYPGVEVRAAAGAAEGIVIARSLRPDLVLLDLHLEDGSGEQVLDALDAEPDLSAIPVVVTSGDAVPEGLAQRHPMVRGHLAKPMDLDEFDRLVRRLLRLPLPPAHSGGGESPTAPG